MKVGIIGLGYVGLPLAVAFAEAGHEVVGLDANPRKVESLGEGRSYINDVPDSAIEAVAESAHPEVDYERLVAEDQLVIDFRGVTRGISAQNLVRL